MNQFLEYSSIRSTWYELLSVGPLMSIKNLEGTFRLHQRGCALNALLQPGGEQTTVVSSYRSKVNKTLNLIWC